MKKEIEIWLLSEVYPLIGMDAPINHTEIVNYIKEDVCSSSDPNAYHTGDFAIGFRRYLEEGIEI